jgi:hypothetical protein
MLIVPMRGLPGPFGPVRYRVGPDGLEWTVANRTYTRMPWSAVARVDEQRDRFVVGGRPGKPVRLIPRDVLGYRPGRPGSAPRLWRA